jgi:dipeptidyl-peptidase-4
MQFNKIILGTFLFIGNLIIAQSSLKSITLEDIWQKGSFRAESMNALNSMNGDFYTLLNSDQATKTTSVDKYSYQTLEKVETLVNSKDLKDLPYFEAYTFSNDETKLVLKAESVAIYRHSEFAFFYIYDLKTKSLQKVADTKIQEATLSPDNQNIAYVFENNIYIKNLNTNEVTQVTFDGLKNHIINGITDWVYEEELGFVRAFEWNADGTSLAFLRFDETEVPEFSMTEYGEDLYPHTITFKYPKAGEKNANVTLHIYDLATKKTDNIDLGNYEYIARIQWSYDKDLLTAQTLNRRQNDLKLLQINRNTLVAKLLLNETSDTYVNVRDYFTFLKDNSFIWSSERDGWEHLYWYNADGTLKNQITKGDFDVTNFYGLDEINKKLFYQSTENGSINKTVNAIDLNGKNKKLLGRNYGNNRLSFSKNKKYFINNFSDAQTPSIYTLHTADGKLLKEIKNNSKLIEKLKTYNVGKKEFSTLTTVNGTFNMWMIKPIDFDPSKKYPVFMDQYSGPGSQSVENSWNGYNDYWYYLLAAKGYIIVCVDGRGTGGKGTEFTKVTYKELGKYETIDQIESARELGKLSYVDASRIGIWGWSYGGFTSSNAILKGGDVFKMAIAVAPVTSWRFYDSIYTERYMQTPQENPDGYDQNSPLFFANQLKGKYLLIHGTGDDNVHVQNTMQMINALIDADKQFDSEVYPDSNHGIYQRRNSRLQLYKRMTKFIEENL